MQEDPVAELQRRIERLERSRRWRGFACALLACTPLMLAFGVPTKSPAAPTAGPTAPPSMNPAGTDTVDPATAKPIPVDPGQEVRTRKLTIVDDSGKAVVTLQARVHAGEILVRDGASETRIGGGQLEQSIRVGDEVRRTNELGNGRLTLRKGSVRSPGLTIHGAESARVELESDKLVVRDTAGKERAKLSVADGPRLVLGDRATGVASIGAGPGGAGMHLTGAAGTPWELNAGVSSRGAELRASARYRTDDVQVIRFPVTPTADGKIIPNGTNDYLYELIER